MAFKTFTSGAVLTAAEVNTYLMQQSVIVCTAATRPSAPVEGMRIAETDTDLEYIYTGSGWIQIGNFGAWSSRTPATSGASVTLGTGGAAKNTQRYTREGRKIVLQGELTFGTSGSPGMTGGPLAIDLPVAGASSVIQIGPAWSYDSSASTYHLGVCELASGASTLVFRMDKTGVTTTAVVGVGGTDPMGWTASDSLVYAITYEAAS